jgi:hypothetical protein
MEELSGEIEVHKREKKRNNERENKRTTEILLFGSPKLAPNQNVELFLAVQKFVIRSKRFTP